MFCVFIYKIEVFRGNAKLLKLKQFSYDHKRVIINTPEVCQLINYKGILSAHSKFKQSVISESRSLSIDFKWIRVLKVWNVSSADFKLFHRFTTHLVNIVNNSYRFADEILKFTNGTKFRAGRENCQPWIFNMCYISLVVILAILKFFEKLTRETEFTREVQGCQESQREKHDSSGELLRSCSAQSPETQLECCYCIKLYLYFEIIFYSFL